MKTQHSPLAIGFRIIAALLAVSILFAAPTVEAKVLKDKKTGLKVKAPKGYRLKAKKNGIYTVTNGDAYVKFIRAYSPLSVKGTAKAFRKASKIKKSKLRKKGKKYILKGRLRKKQVTIEFRRKGKYVDIITYGRKRGKLTSPIEKPIAAQDFLSDPAEFLTAAEILAQLQRIAQSRQGGRVLPLPVRIPMRRYVAPDQGSSALVPNLPGWVYDGAGGAVSGGNTNQGAFGLGLFWPLPSLAPVASDTAIFQGWPITSNGAVQVLTVARIPNTTGWLGPNYDSAMYAVRFRLDGRNWQALMVSGSTVIGGFFYWYQSYVGVPEGGPGGIAQALLNTWASWDNTPAANSRLNQALQTILSTPIPGNPIDPEVFDRSVEAFNEYIRS